jgi:hypothetical protein
MSPFILLLLIVLIFAVAFGYMLYRDYARKRAIEKRRNQFHDRV